MRRVPRSLSQTGGSPGIDAFAHVRPAIRQSRHGADHACRNSRGQRIGSLQKLRGVQRGVPKLRASRPENWRTQGADTRDCFFRLSKIADERILRLLKFPYFTAESPALAR